jgi:hypothetical protein
VPDRDRSGSIPVGVPDRDRSGPIPTGVPDRDRSGSIPVGVPDRDRSGPIPTGVPDRDRSGPIPTGVPDRDRSGPIPTGVGHREASGPVPLGLRDRTPPPPSGLAGMKADLAQMGEGGRVKLLAVVGAMVLLLGILPVFFAVRAAGDDPVFAALDALQIPDNASTRTVDRTDGSAWCFRECRFRERTAHSEEEADATNQMYEGALTAAGWQPWAPALCPDQAVAGHYSCWRRDEMTLDLWVRPPVCTDSQAQQTPAQEPTPAPGNCTGSDISIKVRNAIGDPRTKPQPTVDPSLIGETPDPIFTDDPLEEPTIAPS